MKTELKVALTKLAICDHKNYKEEGSDYHDRDVCRDCGARRDFGYGPGPWVLPPLIKAVVDELTKMPNA